MAIGKVHYSFRPGCDMLKSSDVSAVEAELKEVMGIKFDTEFYKKRKDYPNIPAFLKERIEKVFSKYGVNVRDIWDIRY